MSRYRTPLRYPGGKQKLASFILELLEENDITGGHYVEPYAGGAGVAWELLLDNRVSHVHLNDSSVQIYAFWRSVVARTEELCRLISRASLTVEEWRRQREILRSPAGRDDLELGFSTFYVNRCNRSGVLSGGLIGGLSQSGKWKMDARFPRNELIGRIEAIASRKNSIAITNWDAEKFILDYIPALSEDTLVYCDPPYYEKSSRLYLDNYNAQDHKRIAGVIQAQLCRKWIVSYDASVEITSLYSQRRSFSYDLQYNASRPYKGREVFIFSDDVKIPTRSSLACVDYGIRERFACPAYGVTSTSSGITDLVKV
jgi:DNA adenine methylase